MRSNATRNIRQLFSYGNSNTLPALVLGQPPAGLRHFPFNAHIARWRRDLDLIRRAVAGVVVDGLREAQKLVFEVLALVRATDGQMKDATTKIARFKRLLNARVLVRASVR